MKRSPMNRSGPIKPPTLKPTTESKIRMRKCAVKTCRALFAPRSITHKCCSPACAQQHVVAEKARTDRKERQAGLLALKTRQQWLREAQAAFNAYIRGRDAKEPCISCGRFHDGAYDAGHYRSIGAQPALRFDETNVHKQCVPCNQHKGGNVIEYRLRLLKKIGREGVELLEIEHAPAKYDIEDAKRIKAIYKAKLKSITERAAP